MRIRYGRIRGQTSNKLQRRLGDSAWHNVEVGAQYIPGTRPASEHLQRPHRSGSCARRGFGVQPCETGRKREGGSPMKITPFMIGAGLLVVATQPVFTHHSFAAEFDASKPVTLKGEVTKLEWANPHIWVYLDVKNDQGLQHWQCEGGAQYADAKRLEREFPEGG